MDKLFNNNWLVKIISFVLALMLYGVVSAGDGGTRRDQQLMWRLTLLSKQQS
ncbi:hypothetical protein [Sporolactobacillus inulinus]|uniref:hypothetical protein n=1 Tax=Sporolactobacillus inulinus TaxID=2078 RepID=UPI0021CC5C43|nr:hypothetical protein [Sporolactobacillus inulinus]